jgi:hypothetical protein
MRALVTLPGATLRLWDIQADALLAALHLVDKRGEQAPGEYAPITVGGGKTLIAMLLPTVWQCARPLILTTAALKAQAESELARYRRSFLIHPDLTIISYSIFSHPDHAAAIDALEPDVVICDEAHALLNKDTARGKRIRRYRREHPGCRIATLTGTSARKSILECAEVAHLALADWSPYPTERPTRLEWAEALDPEGSERGDANRDVGALSLFMNAAESELADRKVAAQSAIARRVRSAPGVCASNDEMPDVPLVVEIVQVEESIRVRRARDDLDASWCRPDGEELVTAVEHHEVDAQLRLGGFYAWMVEPDREWLRARREYRRALRAWLKEHPRNEIDSPARLERAIVAGTVVIPEYTQWNAVRARAVEPPKKWVEICETPARQYAALFQGPTLGFGRRTAFAERVARLLGINFYGAGHEAATRILKESGSSSIVASLGAHKQGRNLQQFHRAVIFDPPSAGADWEQLLGRMHRPGQKAERVTYVVTSPWRYEMQQALGEAQWLATTQGQPQRLVMAERTGYWL